MPAGEGAYSSSHPLFHLFSARLFLGIVFVSANSWDFLIKSQAWHCRLPVSTCL